MKNGGAIDERIIAWQRRQFPDAEYAGASAHAAREREEVLKELVDCHFMDVQQFWTSTKEFSEREQELVLKTRALVAAAACLGFSRDRFWEGVEAKLAENQARTWPAAPDADGVYEHVKGGSGIFNPFAPVWIDGAVSDAPQAEGAVEPPPWTRASVERMLSQLARQTALLERIAEEPPNSE